MILKIGLILVGWLGAALPLGVLVGKAIAYRTQPSADMNGIKSDGGACLADLRALSGPVAYQSGVSCTKEDAFAGSHKAASDPIPSASLASK